MIRFMMLGLRLRMFGSDFMILFPIGSDLFTILEHWIGFKIFRGSD